MRNMCSVLLKIWFSTFSTRLVENIIMGGELVTEFAEDTSQVWMLSCAHLSTLMLNQKLQSKTLPQGLCTKQQ